MPDNYIFKYSQCILLIDHLKLISAMDINIIIHFEWQTEMKTANKSRIDQYRHQLQELGWFRKYSTNSVTFGCNIFSPAYTISTQQHIQLLLSSGCDKQISNTDIIYVVQMINSQNLKIVEEYNKADRNVHVLYSKYNIQKRFVQFVGACINKWTRNKHWILSQDIKDQILFYFAKPVIMNIIYNGKNDYILLCPIRDTNWISIKKKVYHKTNKRCKYLEYIRYVMHLEYGRHLIKTVSDINYHEFQLDEKEIYTIVYELKSKQAINPSDLVQKRVLFVSLVQLHSSYLNGIPWFILEHSIFAFNVQKSWIFPQTDKETEESNNSYIYHFKQIWSQEFIDIIQQKDKKGHVLWIEPCETSEALTIWNKISNQLTQIVDLSVSEEETIQKKQRIEAECNRKKLFDTKSSPVIPRLNKHSNRVSQQLFSSSFGEPIVLKHTLAKTINDNQSMPITTVENEMSAVTTPTDNVHTKKISKQLLLDGINTDTFYIVDDEKEHNDIDTDSDYDEISDSVDENQMNQDN
eukprot:194207_1